MASKPLSTRVDESDATEYKAIAEAENLKEADLFAAMLKAYRERQELGNSSELPGELAEVKRAMGRITDIISGNLSSAKLNEENIRSETTGKIEVLERELSELRASSKELADANKKLAKQVQASESLTSAFETLRNECERKNGEIEALKKQLGEQVAKLRDFPSLEGQLKTIEIENAKLGVENRQLQERLAEYKTFFRGRIESNEVQLGM